MTAFSPHYLGEYNIPLDPLFEVGHVTWNFIDNGVHIWRWYYMILLRWACSSLNLLLIIMMSGLIVVEISLTSSVNRDLCNLFPLWCSFIRCGGPVEQKSLVAEVCREAKRQVAEGTEQSWNDFFFGAYFIIFNFNCCDFYVLVFLIYALYLLFSIFKFYIF